MNKIIIIFVIIFCLLSFIGISSLAEEHPIAGEIWNNINMTDIHKNIYLQGIAGGFILSATIKSIPGLSDWNNFILQNNKTIMLVMDEFYKDPANIYISWDLMCLVACQKIKGEDVDQLLRDYRKFAYQKYQRLREE